MLTKKIAYTDFDGVEREEDFLFNLTKAEVMEMELTIPGGMSKYLEQIVQTKDAAKMIGIFKDLILRSYGVKSPDGREFIKNQELRNSFSQTEAYSNLFMELASNAEAAAAFVNGIIPQVSK